MPHHALGLTTPDITCYCHSKVNCRKYGREGLQAYHGKMRLATCEQHTEASVAIARKRNCKICTSSYKAVPSFAASTELRSNKVTWTSTTVLHYQCA